MTKLAVIKSNFIRQIIEEDIKKIKEIVNIKNENENTGLDDGNRNE